MQSDIFDLSGFYALDAENQQEIKDAILAQYSDLSPRSNLKHFVAQYYQLPKRKRDKINTLAETLCKINSNSLYRCAEHREFADYGLDKIKKAPHLFSERFVAYDTGEELGYRGRLRFKVDCSSLVTAAQLQVEMNRAFMAKNLQQKTTAKLIKINFKELQQVSKAQVELIAEMLECCKAELIVDLCGSDAIKLKNPWGAVMLMKREFTTGRTMLAGDKTIVQNFRKKVNNFF